MSHEPVDTVNKPCEATRSLHLPPGHHSIRPHGCRLSRNKIIVPITAQVPSFSQAQEKVLVVRWAPPRLNYAQTHMDGGTHPRINPCYSTTSVSEFPFFIASLSSL